MDDTKETIESFDQLETCRGTIMVDFTLVERAFKDFRHNLKIASDFYNQDQQEQLDRMLGKAILHNKHRCSTYKHFLVVVLYHVVSH